MPAKPTNSSKTHQFQFRVPIEMKKRLEELAEEDGRTVGNLAKLILSRYLKDIDSKDKKRA